MPRASTFSRRQRNTSSSRAPSPFSAKRLPRQASDRYLDSSNIKNIRPATLDHGLPLVRTISSFSPMNGSQVIANRFAQAEFQRVSNQRMAN